MPGRRNIIIMFVTRGMVQELPLVKEMVKSLVRAGSKVSRWVLTSIKDPETNVVSITNDQEELERNLDELNYGGGGDLQEQVLKGEKFLQKFIRKKTRISIFEQGVSKK